MRIEGAIFINLQSFRHQFGCDGSSVADDVAALGFRHCSCQDMGPCHIPDVNNHWSPSNLATLQAGLLQPTRAHHVAACPVAVHAELLAHPTLFACHTRMYRIGCGNVWYAHTLNKHSFFLKMIASTKCPPRLATGNFKYAVQQSWPSTPS